MAPGTSAARPDPSGVAGFIERFASALMTIGFPPMPARVFSALLATDSGTRTAAQLADSLDASPAAISGAVRYLGQLGLLSRERERGSRRDLFRVNEDVWLQAALRREQTLLLMQSTVGEGVDVLGPDTPAGVRFAETLAFFEFLQDELPRVLEKWRAHRATLGSSTPRRDDQAE
jgi:DNA-binding transcriptional ArsR family regulator